KTIPAWLKLAQDGFVLWVLLAAWWGFSNQDIAASGKNWIPEVLSMIMLAMGLTLRGSDIKALRSAGKPLIIGILLQFMIMPLCAWGLARMAGLPTELAVGLILVGAAPGGTASNVVAWLARGDVSLSIAMTTSSTLLAPMLTPFWIWLLASAWLPVDPLPLLLSVMKIVLFPVLIGAAIRSMFTPGRLFLQGFLPLFSMLAIAWIVGVITALNHDQLYALSAGLLLCVFLLNAGGLFLGYCGARASGQSRRRCRTVSIEVGMQNSGLAVALAVAHFSPLTALPAALFSIWHNISGPLLAGIWRHRSNP
ncbi:MAG: bile acid:sodium symporter family protein, partial [Mariprofundaceae bacterium]|nr:bile acid:sodium symporter family protein [Mariprofundaceae bacterium]